MTTGEQTIECPICGEPYKFYPWLAGDQTACSDCRKKASEQTRTQGLFDS